MSIAVIVPAAGRGTRMKSPLPKVLHTLAGRSMLDWVHAACAPLQPLYTVNVVAPEFPAPAVPLSGWFFVPQFDRLGSGHAVMQAMAPLAKFDGIVLIVYGDTPLLTSESLQRIVNTARVADVVIAGFDCAPPSAYGRIQADADGFVTRIIEARDCNAAQAKISLCNSGIMAINAQLLRDLLPQLTQQNAAREYYLTDIVGLAAQRNYRCQVVTLPFDEVRGVNDRAELAEAETVIQQRLRRQAMLNGVTLRAPETIFLHHDTVLAPDCVVHQHTVFGEQVHIESGAQVLPFCHLAQVRVAAGAQVGPFARIRGGSTIEAAAVVGNFAEVKNSRVGRGAKIRHFSYTGDSDVGAKANIGAGTVTCNYDGVQKHKTYIGEGAFVGSGSMIVAPARIGKNSIVGAGSVVTAPVPDGMLGISRPEFVTKVRR